MHVITLRAARITRKRHVEPCGRIHTEARLHLRSRRWRPLRGRSTSAPIVLPDAGTEILAVLEFRWP